MDGNIQHLHPVVFKCWQVLKESSIVSRINKAPKTLQSIKAIVEKIRSGVLDADEIIDVTRNLIAKYDGDIKAWKTLDWYQVKKQYKELLSRPNWRSLPLAAVPIAVKDVYDTSNFVTSYGSKFMINTSQSQMLILLRCCER